MGIVDAIKRAMKEQSASRPTGVALEQECFRLAMDNGLAIDVVSLLCVSSGRDKNLENMRGKLVQLDMLLKGVERAGKTLDDPSLASRQQFDHLNDAKTKVDWDTRAHTLIVRLTQKFASAGSDSGS